MATISTRIDDALKSEAEYVANEIGISLSTAINIFLKRFIANNGFPFSVVAPQKSNRTPIVDTELLDASVKKAISDPANIGISHEFSYVDPKTNKLITVKREEE